MKNIRSRRWVKGGTLFVEETDGNGNIVAKCYKRGRDTRFWRSLWKRNAYSC